jgi:hypothetical protein
MAAEPPGKEVASGKFGRRSSRRGFATWDVARDAEATTERGHSKAASTFCGFLGDEGSETVTYACRRDDKGTRVI